jgi:L-ascorbate metabolism protein UlaG (beta-lactamase superfamily)
MRKRRVRRSWRDATPEVWLRRAGFAGLVANGAPRSRVWRDPKIWVERRRLRGVIATAPATPDPSHWSDRGLYAAWLGHSTVLLKIDGFVVLTDPILSDRAGLDLRLMTVGIRRHVAPALALEHVPRPDLILLSHAHMDHFDMPSLRKLAHRATTIVTARNTADLLHPERYRRVVELGWGEGTRIGPVECRAFEVNHWGARYHSDIWRGYNGYTLESGRYRILFGGDTALTDTFRTVRKARPVDLAIMPIGAYFPRVYYHCTPEQAWQMGNDAGADRILPVHHQTFRLGHEPVDEPIERLHAVAGQQSDRIAVSRIGQQIHIT